MDSFWQTQQGEMIRFRRRQEESVRLSLQLEPPTKRARGGTKAKARAALSATFATDVLVRRARELTTWPKPRAEVALDIFLSSGNRNGARIDHMCKWLLDELAGHVYADDRQVKLLFARASRPRPLPPMPERQSSADPAWAGSELYDEFERVYEAAVESSREPRQAELYVTARTRANVLADLRAVSNLEERWDPFDEKYGGPRRDPIEAMFYRDELVDYRAIFNLDNQDDTLQRRMLSNQIDFHDQSQQQGVVDLIFSSLLTDLLVDRHGIWKQVGSRIGVTPYIFLVGALPGRGESTAFRDNVRVLLEERREKWPGLFPMRARSGISMILFEDPENGKDLDNLMLTLLPDILEVLRPQRDDLQGWVADEADPSDGVPDVPFVEIAAVPAHLTDMAPGSVVFGLSTADRFDSWWHLAANHLKHVLEEEEDRGWW